MGVAGAGAAVGEGRFVLLAGIAGLLAGAFSMAAGEYISMQSQRELFERQIALERAELEAMPEEEEAELAAVYRAKGFTRGARTIARMFVDPEHALDNSCARSLVSTRTSLSVWRPTPRCRPPRRVSGRAVSSAWERRSGRDRMSLGAFPDGGRGF
jgi:hypothetical protein